jgi:hypothetical protein
MGGGKGGGVKNNNIKEKKLKKIRIWRWLRGPSIG